MRSLHGAAALVLAATSVVSQECPPGYAKSGKIDWVSCEVSKNPLLQCATLEVPRDWTQPNSNDKLKLRLVRQPAAAGTTNAKSIIMNPGGPGASGINMVAGGGSAYQKIVGNEFHIIGFDPRGVGQSELYECPENQSNDGRNAYFTDQGIKTALKFNQDQAKECAKTQYKSNLIGTAFVARDIKAIAEAVGEDGLIRYWGYSYGTLLGATVAAMFPKLVDRFVLDGNINPTDYYRGLGDEASADVDKGVQQFFEQCAAAGKKFCAVAEPGQDAKTLQQTFDNFLLNNVTVEQSFSVRHALHDALYFNDATAWRKYATDLSTWYAQPANIDKQSLDKRALDWDPAFNEKDDKWKAPMALDGITCGDVVVRPSPSESNFMKWLTLYTKTSKYASKYAGDVAIRGLYQCSTWTVNAKEKFTGAFSGIETKNPILFINTQYDPVTPLASAQNSAAGFKDARVLQSSGVGHCSSNNESPELNAAIKTYMVSGTFPKENVVYAPRIKNVFTRAVKRTVDGPVRVRGVELPRVFDTVLKRAVSTGIPAGCTKVAASSTPIASASSSVLLSRSSSVMSNSASSKASVTSGPTSQTGSASRLSSQISSSKVVLSSLASASSQALSSGSISSQAISVSSVISIASASITPSASISQSHSLSSMVTSLASSSSQFGAVSNSTAAASSPASAMSSASPSSSAQGSDTPSTQAPSLSSIKVYGNGASSTLSSTATAVSYGQGYPVPSMPAYSASQPYIGGSYASSKASVNSNYGGYQASSANNYGNYQASSMNRGYGDAPVTSSPCPTPAWSSQSGYVPITKTITTTTVKTITQCRSNGYCPINQATPTVVITKTRTLTKTYGVPTSTVYTTRVVDVCSTGLTTKIMTITQKCKSGCTARPTGAPPGWTTTVKYCNACATPSTVTVTYCTACVKKSSTVPGIKTTPTSTPGRPASTPVVPTKPASLPVYGSQPISKPTGAPSSVSGKSTPASSKPAVPVYSKPSVPIGSNSTVVKSTPAVGTPARSTSLQTNPASTGGYSCTGANCPATTPTTTKSVVQFTGAANHEYPMMPFIMPAILAGFAFLL